MVKDKFLEDLVVGKKYLVKRIQDRGLDYIGTSKRTITGEEVLVHTYLDWNKNRGYAMRSVPRGRLEVLRVYKLTDDVPPKE